MVNKPSSSDEREQAERENQQRQCDEHQDRADKGVQNPQQKRGGQQIFQLVAIADVVPQNNDRQQHRDSVDDPTSEEAPNFFGSGLHGLHAENQRVSKMRQFFGKTRNDFLVDSRRSPLQLVCDA